MTSFTASTWRPAYDGPLFVGELLGDVEEMPGPVHDRLVDYLQQVARFRRTPLHVATAFNALHFGFDPEAGGGYRSAILDPELFVRLTPDTAYRPALPVGSFVRLERGQKLLWAEVVARFGAHADVQNDGWVPPALSGAPSYIAELSESDHTAGVSERIILDVEAFGGLSKIDRSELVRLGHRGGLLDARGHLTVPVRSCDPHVGERDDIVLYAHQLLTSGRPLLVGGPLGGLLTDPGDDEVLAAALHAALRSVEVLLRRAPNLRCWGAYATPTERYVARRASQALLGGADIAELVHNVSRSTFNPRYTAVWPLLAARVDDARIVGAVDHDPLHLAGAAEAIVHANLALADEATGAVGGLLPGQVHLRIDDTWQAGGVWRTQRAPVPSDILSVSPLRALGLGKRQPRHDNLANFEDRPAIGDSSLDCDIDRQIGADQLLDELCPEPDTAEPDGIVIEALDDTVVVYSVALRQNHIDNDVLPVPPSAREFIVEESVVVELHHSGEVNVAERVQLGRYDNLRILGIGWPLSFYTGIKLRVALTRGGRRLSATTTLLDHPLSLGESYMWDANVVLLAASLGQSTPADRSVATPQAAPGVPGRYQGIDALRGLIIAALRRHGAEGGFGSRRLTGPQLVTALFGEDLFNPVLLWQVIYTCERLVDDGKLTCEPNPARPERPGSGGPDTFVWWPTDGARKAAELRARADGLDVLRGQIRPSWVPPFLRLLPKGYRPSDEAAEAYVRHMQALKGPNAGTSLPPGHTFVRGHPRGDSARAFSNAAVRE